MEYFFVTPLEQVVFSNHEYDHKNLKAFPEKIWPFKKLVVATAETETVFISTHK